MRPIRDVLVHMIASQRYWIGHVIHGDPREATLRFIDGLTAGRRRDRYRSNPQDARQTASIEEIIWHVVTHEQYHRGPLFTRLALLVRRDLPDQDRLR